jgi:hypothetical protein
MGNLAPLGKYDGLLGVPSFTVFGSLDIGQGACFSC